MSTSEYVPMHAPGRMELDEFLSAPICDEKNGMTLSVLSAMARLGIDPWSEAARLADLSRANATATLISLINQVFAEAAAVPDAASIASRLVKLLPEGARGVAGPTRQAPGSLLEQWSAVTWSRLCAIAAVAAAIAYFVL
jgi:hypothetical protein